MPIFARVAYADGVDPVTLLFLRFVVAAVALAAVLAARRLRPPRGRLLAALVLLGGLGYVSESLAYFFALRYAPAGVVALLLYLYPAIVAVLCAVFLSERLTRPAVVALLLALGGSALTIGPQRGGAPLGVALGVTAALLYAVYIVCSSRVTPHVGPLPSAAVVMASAAAVFAVIALVRGPQLPATATGWLAILAVAVLGTVVAIVAFFAGLDRIGPAQASTTSTLEPVVTVGLAALFLGEAVGAAQLLGGALILAAVVLLARRPGAPGLTAAATSRHTARR